MGGGGKVRSYLKQLQIASTNDQFRREEKKADFMRCVVQAPNLLDKGNVNLWNRPKETAQKGGVRGLIEATCSPPGHVATNDTHYKTHYITILILIVGIITSP